MKVVERLLMILLLAACLIILLMVSYYGIFFPIDYDEAYNLQVVDLLSKGHGYASYGALTGEGPWPFDPHITTGPVIIFPSAVLWKVFNGSIMSIRLFLMTFLWLYVYGLIFLLKNHKAGLMIFTLTVSASLCIIDMQAGKILGELPAAAALIWAAVAISGKKPLIAAIVLGIAIQIKLVYGLAGAIMLLLFFAQQLLYEKRVNLTTLLLSGFLLLLPTISFEVFRFIYFGDVDSYLLSIDELKHFLESQNINKNSVSWHKTELLQPKLDGLYRSLPFYTWVAAGFIIVAAISGYSFLLVSKRIFRKQLFIDHKDADAGQKNEPWLWVALCGLLVAGIAMLSGWITQSAQLSARQALPFLLLSLPALFASGSGIFLTLAEKFHFSRTYFIRLIFLLMISGFIMTSLYIKSQIVNRIGSYREVTEEQQKVVDVINRAKPLTLYVDKWWQNPEYQILCGIPGVPVKTGKSQLLVVQNYQLLLTNSGRYKYRKMCSKIIYSSPHTLVGWLPEFNQEDLTLQILDWGLKSTQTGVVPNKQAGGACGLWIKTSRINTAQFGLVKVYFDGKPAYGVRFQHPGELITAFLPPDYFKKAGKYAITVKHIATGHIYQPGFLVIE